MSDRVFTVEVRPQLPQRIARLEELANDLYYSWVRSARRLFSQLDKATWKDCNSNPKVFLRRVSQQTLDKAATDPIFLSEYGRVLSVYDTYMQEQPLARAALGIDREQDLIAYFSAEFGLHQSLPIYAGGLGILAGDYCKAMSNLWVPFFGVGLLYREGYFKQRILCNGEQQEEYPHVDPEDLPIHPAVDAHGKEVRISVELEGRQVWLRVWRVRVGHICLCLLDSDLEENTPEDRRITNQLYGGGSDERIRQEVVLGVGGTRALRALDLQPSVWHINEGHAGFLVLERCREYVAQGHDFDTALTLVAGNTVFTTHTPVPAGHDIFTWEQICHYLGALQGQLGIDPDACRKLGSSPLNPAGFNMTTLSINGSGYQNGVSRIHGTVASSMESYNWPQIPAEENPITYVTNGVDAETFLGRAWISLFEMYKGRGWRAKLTDIGFWDEFIAQIPDQVYKSVRQILKAELLNEVKRRVVIQYRRNGSSEMLIQQVVKPLNASFQEILIIGFARRFATYKRATLLFRDLPRLQALLSDPHRPVLLLFAGKAHPNDQPGKQLIREIAQLSQRPEFIGKLILLEDYNLSLARTLYPGVDLWLNLPEYPKEACGTSGMKAAINGAVNLSVLDGWWGEAYDGSNGWAITPSGEPSAELRDRNEAAELLNLLEQEVIPSFFAEDDSRWIGISKASMKSILPRFNAMRMARDYIDRLYIPARDHGRRLARDNGADARRLAEWKHRVRQAWPGVRLRLASEPPAAVASGAPCPIEVTAELNGLSHEDVVVECVFGEQDHLERFIPRECVSFTCSGDNERGETRFHLDIARQTTSEPLTGLEHYKIRIYPHHELLSHPFACGCMLWL